jgi:hypothetical protein
MRARQTRGILQLAVLLGTMGLSCPTDGSHVLDITVSPGNAQALRNTFFNVTIETKYAPVSETSNVLFSFAGEVPVGIAFVAPLASQTGCGVSGMTLNGTGVTICGFRIQVGPQAQLGVFKMRIKATWGGKSDEAPFDLTILSG